MSFAKIFVAAAAASMAVAPIAASASPAAGLSIAPAVKGMTAAAPSGKKGKISQAGIIAIVVIAAGGAIAGIVAGTTGSNRAVSR
ncbi:hypothetical protein [Sphingomonas sp.]|uniref:hypothetical protein n=1 Tax=Sphingomonas sp. TaxID=28214 RepID=UPI001D9D6ACE|nr:hypothetical protein [Sphingomonas sp.]MBX9797358.1 hypothetical protein [Sphingomonas sp.]